MQGLSILVALASYAEVNPNRFVAYNELVGESLIEFSPYVFRKLVKELKELGLVERYRHAYRVTFRGWNVVQAVYGEF